MTTPKEQETVESVSATMRFEDVMRELNEAIVEAKEEARLQVERELREMLHKYGPRFAKRLKKSLVRPCRGPRDTVRKTIASSILEDRSMAARIYMRSLGQVHLKRFLYIYMVDRVRRLSAIPVDKTVDDLLETARLAIPNYPEIARPPLPRRCDLSRMLGRFCGCTRKL